MYLLCFFFQAEDGIRDLTVTGVQTCALPILTPRPLDAGLSSPSGRGVIVDAGGRFVGTVTASEVLARIEAHAAAVRTAQVRSEERRVGEEGRSRWSAYH